jgi:hypothetical protein
LPPTSHPIGGVFLPQKKQHRKIDYERRSSGRGYDYTLPPAAESLFSLQKRT